MVARTLPKGNFAEAYIFLQGYIAGHKVKNLMTVINLDGALKAVINHIVVFYCRVPYTSILQFLYIILVGSVPKELL